MSYSGGNPNLRPEQSESTAVGVVLTPKLIPGFRLSIDYTHIAKRDNIATLPTLQEIINAEALFPGTVIRGAPGAGETVGQITGLDSSLLNLSRATVSAFDVQLDQVMDTSAGKFNFFMYGAWQTHYETRLGPDSPTIENVGYTSSSPLKFKANFGLSWDRGSWSAGWVGRYYDSYMVINPAIANAANASIVRAQGNDGIVKSQNYHDLFGAYRLRGGSGFFSDTELRLAVQNVFNTKPPIDFRYVNGYSPYGDPRLAAYSFSVKTSF